MGAQDYFNTNHRSSIYLTMSRQRDYLTTVGDSDPIRFNAISKRTIIRFVKTPNIQWKTISTATYSNA